MTATAETLQTLAHEAIRAMQLAEHARQTLKDVEEKLGAERDGVDPSSECGRSFDRFALGITRSRRALAAVQAQMPDEVWHLFLSPDRFAGAAEVARGLETATVTA